MKNRASFFFIIMGGHGEEIIQSLGWWQWQCKTEGTIHIYIYIYILEISVKSGKDSASTLSLAESILMVPEFHPVFLFP